MNFLSSGLDPHYHIAMHFGRRRSWRHMVDSGSTISWEAWDHKYKPNHDWNHAWGAAPANLLPRFILGVEATKPGWSHARIRPFPGDLAFAKGRDYLMGELE